MNGPEFYHSARLARARRHPLLRNLLAWAASIGVLYLIGMAADAWMRP